MEDDSPKTPDEPYLRSRMEGQYEAQSEDQEDEMGEEIIKILELEPNNRSKAQIATLSSYLLRYKFFQKVAEKHTVET